MAIGTLVLSSNHAASLSTWEGYEGGYNQVYYTNPTTDNTVITVSIPPEMNGATFNSATLTYTVSSDSGTRRVCYKDTYINVTNSNLLARLQNGESLDMYFGFTATGGTGGEGQHSAYCVWDNITITVDYTPATGITGNATITNAGTAVYSLERASLAYGESITLGITARPTVTITRVTTEIRPGTLSQTVSFKDVDVKVTFMCELITD